MNELSNGYYQRFNQQKQGNTRMELSHINLLTLIQQDTTLKYVASTNGGEYAGPCPFCGGRDRFLVWPNQTRPAAYCRHCQKSWDANAYLRQRHNLSFAEAKQRLNLADNSAGWRRTAPQAPVRKRFSTANDDKVAIRDSAWQDGARVFIEQCVEVLHGPKGRPGSELLQSRGISLEIAQEHRLGYHQGERGYVWGETRVWLPRGLVLPWEMAGTIYKVALRRLPEDIAGSDKPKYVQAKGGADGLYGYDAIFPGCTVVIVEGEFDALSILAGAGAFAHEARIVPAATGSTTRGRTLEAVTRVLLADRILLAFDADAEGDKAAEWWRTATGGKGLRLVPLRHDVNDMLRIGDDVSAWLSPALQ